MGKEVLGEGQGKREVRLVVEKVEKIRSPEFGDNVATMVHIGPRNSNDEGANGEKVADEDLEEVGGTHTETGD